MLSDNPHDFDAAHSLSILRANWAHMLDAKGPLDAALADLTKNAELLEPLLKLEPQSLILRDGLYRTFGNRTQLLEKHGRYAESAQVSEPVVEFSPDDLANGNRLTLALLWVRAGNYQRSEFLADELANRIPVAYARVWLDAWAATIYCEAISATRKDERIGSDVRALRATDIAKAHGQGYEKSGAVLSPDDLRKYRAEFRADPDVKPLLEFEEVRQRWEALTLVSPKREQGLIAGSNPAIHQQAQFRKFLIDRAGVVSWDRFATSARTGRRTSPERDGGFGGRPRPSLAGRVARPGEWPMSPRFGPGRRLSTAVPNKALATFRRFLFQSGPGSVEQILPPGFLEGDIVIASGDGVRSSKRLSGGSVSSAGRRRSHSATRCRRRLEVIAESARIRPGVAEIAADKSQPDY